MAVADDVEIERRAGPVGRPPHPGFGPVLVGNRQWIDDVVQGRRLRLPWPLAGTGSLRRPAAAGHQRHRSRAKRCQAGRAKLRTEALAAAERRLLEEFVVVPLLFMNEAVLINPAIKGMDSPEALKNPGFTGSLIHVKR